MPLEQNAERLDQQLALAKDIAALLQREMHLVEGPDQIGVEEGVAREVRHLVDAELIGQSVERKPRQVERAVPPAGAPPHPAAVGLLRIEYEQGRGRGVLQLAT